MEPILQGVPLTRDEVLVLCTALAVLETEVEARPDRFELPHYLKSEAQRLGRELRSGLV